MKFIEYGTYSDCIFPLIDKIPSHWEEQKIKFQLNGCIAGGTPDSDSEVYWIESGRGTPWVAIADMTRFDVITATEKDVTDRGIASKGLQLVPKGTLLYSIFASLGKVAEAGVDLVTNQAILALVPKATLNRKYFSYWLKSIEPYLMYFCTSNTQNNLNAEKVRNLPLFLPSNIEQQRIANFLDHETAKIDTQIAKQQELIKLLKEKRQSVISHAVTKGLNPNAPMRESGVEWLGEVPENWMVSKFKYLVVESSAGPYGSSLTKSMYTHAGVRVYGQQQVIPDDFTIGDYYISESKFETMRRYEVFPEDVLISVMGTVGKVAVVPYGVERGVINPRLVKYRVNKNKILPLFIKASILSEVCQSQLQFSAQGSTMDGLNMQILGELPIAFPTLNDQEKILEEVSKVQLKFSLSLDRAQRAVDLLSERRTALISAAVTGKIDVRDWQPPNDAAIAA
ncbi:restriction endonuclease subunit S [Undibacterium seohonense]|uniref:Restriction endonuclease subunit S n=1 Tax=Undibacterium seohonense TaxID=1344950 RepID=A0ABR6WZG5_9BURK|nr:restriction endonuclease subunit S [Undibacterium seohonense]MBC3805793.1 restriction endonuclease subunit S [Undibacterium seohonense]